MDLIDRRHYPVVFVLLLAAVLPFVILTHFAQPSADDFCYANLFRGANLWDGIRSEYLGWKGRYSSIFLTASFHQAGGMLLTYQYALYAFLAGLSVAIYTFVRALTEAAGTRMETAFLALGLGALYLGTMPRVPATLYWLDGAFQYQLAGIFVLLSLAALLTLYRSARPLPALAACAFIFVAVGASEVAMMTLVAVVAVMSVNRMYVHGRDRLLWTAVIMVTLASSALLILAPGNYVREQYASDDAHRFWFSFSHAWYYAGLTLADWISSAGLWLATGAFVPVAMHLVYLQRVRRDASPLRLAVIAGLLAGLVWSYFFGLWWVAANNPPARMLNMIHLLFLAGWFTAVLELAAVVAARCVVPFTRAVFPVSFRLGALAAGLLLGVFLVAGGHARTAYADLAFRVPEYDRIMQDRYARIAVEKDRSGSGPPAVVLPRVPDPPRLLVYSDIQGNRGDWRNICFARYFGIDSVVRR